MNDPFPVRRIVIQFIDATSKHKIIENKLAMPNNCRLKVTSWRHVTSYRDDMPLKMSTTRQQLKKSFTVIVWIPDKSGIQKVESSAVGEGSDFCMASEN